MSLIESYAASRSARLIRLGAKPKPKPKFTPIDPVPFYRQMWMWDLVSPSGPLMEPDLPALKVGTIIDEVCRYFLIRKRELLSSRGTLDLTYPRQIGYYLARTLTRAGTHKVGREFDRDHSTVIFGEKKIRRLIKTDWMVAYDIAHLEAKL
jgi:hypothetical protein